MSVSADVLTDISLKIARFQGFTPDGFYIFRS